MIRNNLNLSLRRFTKNLNSLFSDRYDIAERAQYAELHMGEQGYDIDAENKSKFFCKILKIGS